jgi:modulator of FtsH protease HflK
MPSSNPRGSRSRGPWGSGPQPDLEEFLRRSQDKLHSALSGNLGGRGIALIALASTALWGFSGFFRVEPDFFPNRQRALVQRLRVRVTTLGLI